MSLSETTKVDLIEIVENCAIQVRTATIISRTENGETAEVSRSHVRHVLMPGSDIAGEAARVQAVANAVWTPEVIAEYQASLPQPEPEPEPEA